LSEQKLYVPAESVTSSLKLVAPKLPGATAPLMWSLAVVAQLKLGNDGRLEMIGKWVIGFGPELRICGRLPPIRLFV
jgi:hypothetical protein